MSPGPLASHRFRGRRRCPQCRKGRPEIQIETPNERSVRSGRPVGEGARQPQVVGHVQGACRASKGSQAFHGAAKAAPDRQPQRPSLLAGGPSAEAALAAAAAMAQPFVEASPPRLQFRGPRASSQPKSLSQYGQASQQLTSAGSGAAPVSPNPTAPPPVLNRASSTCPAGLHSAASTHSSSAADEVTTAAGASRDAASRDVSRRGKNRGTAADAAFGAEPSPSISDWRAPATGHKVEGGAAGETAGRQAASSPLALHWHPNLGALPPEHATPAWVHRAAQQPAAPLAPVPTTTVVPPPQPAAAPARVPGIDGSPGSPLSPEGPAPGSSLGSVSMLTYMLRGPSAASSAAASRESSVRSGIKR